MYKTLDTIESVGIVSIRDSLLERQKNNKPVFRLESGDPSFPIPTHVEEAINKALKDGKTHYTQGAGIPELREAISDKLHHENGICGLNPSNVLITNGAMHGLYVTFQALLEDQDEVVIQDPCWTETADNIRLAGGIPMRASSMHEMESLITKKTKAIVINSPHNPTGKVLSKKEFELILDLCSQYGLTLVSDEAYEHVVFSGSSHVSPAAINSDNVVSIFSFSKSYAMSGLRLGYVATKNKTLLERMSKLLRCTINGVNSATQYGGVAAITGPQNCVTEMKNAYETRRNILFTALIDSEIFNPIKPDGAFYMWAKLKDNSLTGWSVTKSLIDNYGIGSAPGEVFSPNCSDSIRFSFACSTAAVAGAATTLRNIPKKIFYL